MTTIIINAITHKAACCDSLTDADEVCYDENIESYFAGLRKDCEHAGFDFQVDHNGHGTSSYRVVAEGNFEELQEAHEFMQSRVDFWECV